MIAVHQYTFSVDEDYQVYTTNLKLLTSQALIDKFYATGVHYGV